MKSIVLLLLSFHLLNTLYAQDPIPSTPENCKNGIDDDGDGKIDLNDSECFCVTEASEFSLLPNPSFELHNCCPVTVSQTVCMENWFQAGYGTTDYLNECGESMDIAISPITGEVIDVLDSLNIFPYPNGDGVVRTVAFNGWTEYLGTCLTSPMTAGTTYNLKMYLASYNVFDPFVLSTVPIDINIYGSACGNLPFDGMEPDSNLHLLGQISYLPQAGWVDLELTFTPSVNYNALVFGPEYSLEPYYADHFQVIFYDHLRLTDGSIPTFPTIDVSGDPCSGTVQIMSGETVSDELSWYDNGVYLSGVTTETIELAVSYPENSVITVRVDALNTCATADLSTLSFEACLPDFEPVFPNVLTINNDGVNDVYLIDIPTEHSVEFRVVNRWGNVVFEAENYANNWKPTELSEGVYYFIAKVTDQQGQTNQYSGPIHLIGSR
jgi:hypothetical protein